jgi:hypothetical protein
VNELLSVPISPWYTIPAAVGLLALTFVFVPGVLLHLGVLLYPKGHVRRREFTAELYAVPYWKRPFWVAGTLVRCAFEGLPERKRSILKDRRALAEFTDRELRISLQNLTLVRASESRSPSNRTNSRLQREARKIGNELLRRAGARKLGCQLQRRRRGLGG